jgi:RNA polymerase sigma-70 factor (ECF subfamily)
MEPVERDDHLSQIETSWTKVFLAHQGAGGVATEAQRALMQRYGGAVHRYLLASLRDRDAADDLAQEFALRFLRGDFHRANPEQGRFRDFVKRAVYQLMVDHHRQHKKQPEPLAGDGAIAEPAEADHPGLDHDQQFLVSWRKALMERAWTALDQVVSRTGQPLSQVLRLRVNHPELRSPAMADQLSEQLGRKVNAGWVRLNLHRARDLFVDLLLSEVAQSLGDEPDADRLEQELAELGLLEYCRPALKRRDHRRPEP